MLILENVKRKNELISADYSFSGYPGEKGSFVYDVKNDRYKSVKFPNEEEPEKMYGFGKVKYLIKQMIQYDNYPETVKCRWY